MTNTVIDPEPNRLTPAESFKIIGNETRIAILQELAATKDRQVSFTELRKRVGMRDGSQFNYHLQKLENGFVQKTDEGYHISCSGLDVLEVIARGAFTESPSFGPVPLDAPCVRCGAPLEGRYDDGVLVGCSACGTLHSIAVFPPSGIVGRSDREVFAASDRHLRASYRLVRADMCPGCYGPLDRTLLTAPERPPDSVSWVGNRDVLDFEHGVGAFYECAQCGRWAYLTVGEHLLDEPELAAFFSDQGRDLDAVRLWELPWAVPAAADDYAAVVSTDPIRFEVRIPLNGEELVVTVDDRFEVVNSTVVASSKSATA